MTSMHDMNFAFNQGLDAIRRKLVSEFEQKRSDLGDLLRTHPRSNERATELEIEIATAKRYIDMIDKLIKQ